VVFSQSCMGQWSELRNWRMLASIESPLIIIDYDIRNLSSLQVTWCLPEHFLDQVNIPSWKSRSMRQRVLMISQKETLSLSNFLVAPLFSSRDLMWLKSPPRIHYWLLAKFFKSWRESLNFSFSCWFCGPYTFVIKP
jgi:hypothetical protein